jgi:hypothetical protein
MLFLVWVILVSAVLMYQSFTEDSRCLPYSAFREFILIARTIRNRP